MQSESGEVALSRKTADAVDKPVEVQRMQLNFSLLASFSCINSI